jgi:hypothetical protein
MKAKRKPKTPVITEAWLEWARQRGACPERMEELKPGMPITALAYGDLRWVVLLLRRRDGIEYAVPTGCGGRCCRGLPSVRQTARRIAREVEIVDVEAA